MYPLPIHSLWRQELLTTCALRFAFDWKLFSPSLKMLAQHSDYDSHCSEGPDALPCSISPCFKHLQHQGASASTDADACPARAASCFHQRFHRKVLGGAAPGSAPRAWARLSCPVNYPGSWWVEHYRPHCVGFLIPQADIDFQACSIALYDIKSEATARLQIMCQSTWFFDHVDEMP